MSYSLLRSLLFQLSPEVSHEVSLEWMSAVHRLKLLKSFIPKVEASPVEVMGIKFPNSVGLAAGVDKNADYTEQQTRSHGTAEKRHSHGRNGNRHRRGPLS